MSALRCSHAERTLRVRGARAAMVLCAALAGCSLAPSVPTPVVYDFGLLPAPVMQAAFTTAPALGSVHWQVPGWLDAPGIVYRLEYLDPLQVAVYRDSRWAAPPAALLAERLRQRLARVAPATFANGPTGSALPALRIELEEFSHVFASPERSRGLLRMRASLVDAGSGRILGQRVFTQDIAASSGNALGGTRALVAAADAAIDELLAWAQTGAAR